jgi:hypothetical protein
MSTAPNALGQPAEHRLPPIAELTVVSMALAIAGGIVMASYIPRHPPIGIPIALVSASVLVLVVDLMLLVKIPEFAWDKFSLVARWALLAYAAISGMLLFVFIRDDTRGSSLVLLTLMLLIFAVDVPLVLAFSVARFQPPSRRR